MKNPTILMFLQMFFLIILMNCSQRKYQDELTYFATHCDQKIIINGVLDDKAWISSKEILLMNNKTGESVSDDMILTRTKLCYDDENLYVAFECYDLDISSKYLKRDEPLWNQDVVEIFIDTDGDMKTYYEIEISPQNVIFDAHIIIPTQVDVKDIAQFNFTDIRTAVLVDGTLNHGADTDRKWTVEVAIPFEELISSMNKKPLSEMIWKVNFYRINKDMDGTYGSYAWSPTRADFHVPSKFGKIIFNY